MDFSTFNIVRGIFAVFVVLGAVQPSQSFQFDKTPDNPFIFVEGVSTLPVQLEWLFTLSNVDVIILIQVTRRRPGEVNAEIIARKTQNAAQYQVAAKFETNYTMRNTGTLVINKVTNADEYTYTFSVFLDSEVNPRNSFTRIIVFVPPKITQIPARNTEVAVGQNVTLQCNASGDPLPNITWTKDGIPARDFNVSGHVLHLVNVQRKDAGSYRCTATNGYGSDATSVSLVSIRLAPTVDPTKRTSGGLTDGESAGIIVGIVLVFLIILGIILYCCCCSKKKNHGGSGAVKLSS